MSQSKHKILTYLKESHEKSILCLSVKLGPDMSFLVMESPVRGTRFALSFWFGEVLLQRLNPRGPSHYGEKEGHAVPFLYDIIGSDMSQV